MAADERGIRADVVDQADALDARIRDLVARMKVLGPGRSRERMIDAIMGLCLAADAARAFARDDVDAALEHAKSMAYYAGRVLGGED